MRFLIACMVTGALIGFVYTWWRMTPGTKHVLSQVLSLPIPSEKQLRMERARTIGYIKGTRLSGATIIGFCGAAVGLILGLATLAIASVIG